jgi:beta-galactosidase
MVRLWAWEAFAHGAEVVSYFRWRQAPFAQEQMHAGLLRPDSAPAPGLAEAAEVAREIAQMPEVETGPAPVAIVLDYAASWAWETQPQGRDFDYFRLVFSAYRALRRAGLSVDILPPDTSDLSPWKAVLAPGLATLTPELIAALGTYRGVAILGPRTNAKTADMAIPVPLPPNLPGLEAVVARVESLPPGTEVPVAGGGSFVHWAEEVEGSAAPLWLRADGRPAMIEAGALRYLAGWPDASLWDRLVAEVAEAAGLPVARLPDGLRLRDAGPVRFAINYGPEPVEWQGRTVPAAGVIWTRA